jgi:NitT/TauT family transport system substrate-binding protein
VNHALLVKTGSSLTVQDLGTGKTPIALNTRKNIEELMLRRFLDKNNVPQSNLNIVTVGFPDMLPALDRGDVQVASVVEPFIQPALRTGKYKSLACQYLDVSPNTAVATYAVTRRWIHENPRSAEKFVRAFRRIDEYMKHNDAETRRILASFTRISQQDLPVIGMPAFEPKLDRQSVVGLIQEMRRYRFITTAPDPNAIVNGEGVK